jgi:hypothetical protein
MNEGKFENNVESDSKRWEREWEEFYQRSDARGKQYVEEGVYAVYKTLAWLNDEKLGHSLALANKIKSELALQYNAANLYHSPRAMKGDGDRIERGNEFALTNPICEKVLGGKQIDQEDIRSANFPGYDWSMELATGKLKNEGDELGKRYALESRIWHETCQYPKYWLRTHMPNIFEIPENEQEVLIREAMERYVIEHLGKRSTE